MARRRAPKNEDEGAPGAPDWIVTFTDMISLLVTFFVLLMTFSSLEEYDLLRVKGVLTGAAGTLEHMKGPRVVAPPETDLLASTDPLRGAAEPPERPTHRLTEPAEQARRRDSDARHLDLLRAPDGLIVRFAERHAFAPGSTQPSATLEAQLAELAATLRHWPHRVVVEGHTDDLVRPTAMHPDAGALGLARARAAADAMLRAGLDPERIQIASFGADRPARTGDTPEARRANRRVEVRVIALDPARAARLEMQWSEGDR